MTPLHRFYPVLIDGFAESLIAPLDLSIAKNRGLDIRPFVETPRRAKVLSYSLFCKPYSKYSPHRTKGGRWLVQLVDGRLGGEAAPLALRAFDHDLKLARLASFEARA